MESRGLEDSKNVKTSQAYFFEGFISFFEDFSLTICLTCHVTFRCCDVIVLHPILVVDKLFPWKIYSD